MTHQDKPRNFFAEWNKREKEEQERRELLKEITETAAIALGKGLDLVRDNSRS